MKLWLISQTVNRDYDTYDSAVVAAETEDDARLIVPHGQGYKGQRSWADPEDIIVEHIGEAIIGTPAGVVLSSFNAG